ncbi:enoyl-CoA hydratase [Ampelomyces quisqualis]|uniref:Enoyl-CoA hydratase n=1 Tax=Ampelomyces quisqualis TaxID=50730 RepID=A0A6A5QWY3_AMPQU|nr:enoyl-CoA hydratase [Ampelomyces quisqualis]
MEAGNLAVGLQTSELSGLVVSIQDGGVAVLELNRPSKRNALSQALVAELAEALNQLDRSPTIFVVVLTGCGPFCAGADLNELATLTTAQAHQIGWLKGLEEAFSSFRKPVIAAVRGFALGGGFEVALMCDIILASEDARFGFPEITLGTIPGAGGTQRLTKTVGKQKAMEIILTGATVTAAEMERLGVVNRIVPVGEDVLAEAQVLAQSIASFSAPAVGMAKQAILAAETTTLKAGLEIERALYYSSFSLADCREGVAAFREKRQASFQHR